MVTSEKLDLTFKEVGNFLHFKEVKAEFAPFRDLKVKWIRTADFADFSVSDYLDGAPEEVVRDIAETIMLRICGEEPREYSRRTVEWLTSHEFRALNQEKYVERSRSIDIDPENTSLRKKHEKNRLLQAR